MKNKYPLLIISLLLLQLLTFASADLYPVGGGGSYTPIVPCEDWCPDSKPYHTFCVEDECLIDIESRDEYFKQFDGRCSTYFDLDSEGYNECWNWWMDYYDRRIDKNLVMINFNLMIALGILTSITILHLINLFNDLKKDCKKKKRK